MILSVFSCAQWPSVYILWRNVYLGLLSIFWLGCLVFGYWAFWAVCKFGRLICWVCCKYFLPLSGLFFILFMISFAVQKLLSLIRSHLFIFVFISITVEDGWKKLLLPFMSKNVLLKFSCKSFIVSSLTFRSSIHFECIFVYGTKECSNFFFFF